MGKVVVTKTTVGTPGAGQAPVLIRLNKIFTLVLSRNRNKTTQANPPSVATADPFRVLILAQIVSFTLATSYFKVTLPAPARFSAVYALLLSWLKL